ncbi:MAG: hypothetical protein QOH60_3888 [Mycobacterium sp.]|jgi:uncharacterized membrane protein HdeD (DUF308 family)|nr:hypothetical protein [Mycobacterium sp.]
MTAPTPPILLKHMWKTTLASGILSLILGILVLWLPGASIVVASILFGIYLLISGIVQVIFAFSLHVSAGGRVLLFISGAASLILAVLAFRHINDAVLLLAIWVGVGFIFRGVSMTVSAISDPDIPGRGWEIFFGLTSLVAGIFLLGWPMDSLPALVWAVGVWLLVIGVFEIVSAFGIRKAANNVASLVGARTPASET